MRKDRESEFNKLGFYLGDEIEVKLLGAIDSVARFVITEEVLTSGHFPIQLSNGDIEYCHLDHIDKANIRLIRRA